MELSLSPVSVEDRLEEARWIALEVAVLLDIPYKEPVLAVSPFKSALVNTSEKFILAPKLIQKLDDEEFLFWTTYQCVISFAAQEIYEKDPNAYFWFWMKFGLCIQVATIPSMMMKEVSLLAAVVTGALLTPLSIYLIVRLHLSSSPESFHRAFEVAAQLTGLADAGERMFKKSLALQQEMPSGRRKAYLMRLYEISVPPQYRSTLA